MSAVTKLLDKPGDLQNGALVTTSLPGPRHDRWPARPGHRLFPRHSGSGSTPSPGRPRRTSPGPVHRVPEPGEADGPAR